MDRSVAPQAAQPLPNSAAAPLAPVAGAPPADPAASAPPARPEVEHLQSYSAPLEGRRGLLRLDFNENTVGPSPRVVEAIRAIPADHYAIYPEYDGLRQAVVAALAVPPGGQLAAPGGSAAACDEPGGFPGLSAEHIGLFNGVDAAIHAVFHAYGDRGDRLLTTSPTFGYYDPCARMQGMTIEAIPYRLPDFGFPLQGIRAALAVSPPPKLLLLCNPNNPTGTRLAAEQVLELAAAAPQTLVVVDELYEAFTGDSVLPLLAERARAAAAQVPAVGAAIAETQPAEVADPFAAVPNLLVLRSLAKTAGLAGLRIGFAIGSPALVDRVSRVTGPYDINSFAVSAAFAALEDQSYVDGYVAEVLRARDWLAEQLQAAGVRHHLAGGNYLLIWPKADPALVEARLRDEAGILVRSMAGKPLIDGSLRVSIGTLEQMERFWGAWRAIEG